MTYIFETIQNGQIAEGYARLDIQDGQAQVNRRKADQVALAKKYGGRPLRRPATKETN